MLKVGSKVVGLGKESLKHINQSDKPSSRSLTFSFLYVNVIGPGPPPVAGPPSARRIWSLEVVVPTGYLAGHPTH